MKILEVVVFLTVVALCKADYSDKQKQKLDESTSKCIEDLDLAKDSDLGKKFKYGQLKEKDDAIKKFISCSMQKLSFMNEDGTILEESIIEFLADKYDRVMAMNVITKCSKLKNETIEDKAAEFYDCFFMQKSFDI